jgi:hypothetical protein
VGQTSGTAMVVGGVLITNPGRTFQTQCVLSIQAKPAKPNPSPAMADWIIASWQASGSGC